jgi:ubiquinone/menaquinone biosynthesis C-methylase UbiE
MPATSFKDYFSKQAADYAKYRPHYPAALFDYLASITAHHDAAWDCATGNGQVALGLAPYFQHIYATDASLQQITQAFPQEPIHYSVATAEHSGLADHSVDLITVGQALHWFDLERFYQEVRRVAKPNGAIAVWCYGFFEIPTAPEAVQQVLKSFYQLIEPFWTPERQSVNQGYRTLPFPFIEIKTPSFQMTARWTANDLIGYLSTWSATQRFLQENDWEAIADFANQLRAQWGTPHSVESIQWQISLRIGQVS